MSDHDHKGFNATTIFYWLFGFTALEVGWGYLGHYLHWGHLLLWGGLILWAFCKGFLIASYFMHLRFEGWILKGLIAPTPFLVLVILGVLSPDISCNPKLDHPIGSMYDPQTGEVKDMPVGAAHENETGNPGTASAAAAPAH